MSGGCQNRTIQLTEILNIPKFSVWQIRKNARSCAGIAWSEPTLKSTRKSGRHYSRVTQCVPAWPWPVQDLCRLLQVIYHRKPPSLYCVLVCYEIWFSRVCWQNSCLLLSTLTFIQKKQKQRCGGRRSFTVVSTLLKSKIECQIPLLYPVRVCFDRKPKKSSYNVAVFLIYGYLAKSITTATRTRYTVSRTILNNVKLLVALEFDKSGSIV